MKNRIASLFLVFAMLMSLCNFAVARDNRITVQSGGAEKFTDVPTDHWAYAYINKVVGSGLFNGKTATTFEPSNAMTRSQFVLVMDRMEGMQSLEGQYTTTIFPDVAPGRLAAGPIKWANEQGFVLGFGDGTFKPDSPITRGQFAALIHRYIIAKRYTNLHVVDPEPAQFTDAGSVSSAFTADVEYARVHGLLTGYSDGTVRASNPITRAAIAAILARFLDLVTESGYTPLLDGPEPGTTPGTDEPENPPVDVPTSYSQIKLSTTNAKRGTTTFLSVLRNGVQVASDDVRPGDVVTLSHVPESGYYAKITVKDSKGKEVTVTTNGNISTFTMPENMPVTITLKYLKEGGGSSSGSSGSSGGSSGGGSSGGNSNLPPVVTVPYYLTVNATAGDGGTVYLTTTQPKDGDAIPHETSATITAAGSTASLTFTQNSASVSGYAVFVPDSTHYFRNATAPTGVTLTPAAEPYTGYTVELKDGDATVTATYVRVTAPGSASSTAPALASVNGVFGTSSGGNTEDTFTWTVSVTNGDYANYQFAEERPASPTAVTAQEVSKSIEMKDIPAGTSKSVYLVVSPQDGYKFGEVVLDVAGSATLTCVYPATQSATDAVRVYQITRNITANTTTGVSIRMQVEDGVGKTHSVEVKSFLDATELTESNTAVPVRASVDKPAATFLNPVNVKIPVITTPGGYDFVSISDIKVTEKDGGKDITADVNLIAGTSDASNKNYSFVMPDKDVVVSVTYRRVDNLDLTYDVTVNVNGKQASDDSAGSVSVNIAGITVTTDATKTYHVTMADGSVSVTDGTSVTKMKQTDYLDLYPERTDYRLPVYLTATPVAAKGYKFNGPVTSTPSNVVVKSDAMTDAQQFILTSGTPLVINANFEKITSYGYNLTIVGPGTVGVTFNGSTETYGDQTDLPKNYSSNLIVGASSTLTLSQPTLPGSDYEASAPVVKRVDANGNVTSETAAYGTAITLNEGQLTDIIVDIHKKDRQPVPFSVEVVGTGTVEIKPETGRAIVANPGASVDTIKASLDVVSSEKLEQSSGTRNYYAYEGAIITLIPTGTVKSIAVTQGSSELTDILSTKGFSFQLKATTTAKVEFGTLDSYSVKVQVPYGGGSPSMNSESTSIKQGSTIGQILYSLNDGKRAATTTNENGIVNDFKSTPNTVNQTLSYYLRNPVLKVKDDDGNVVYENGQPKKQSGSDSIKDMLEDTVKANISNIIPSIVEEKKAEMKNNSADTVEAPLSAQMKSKQDSTADRSVEISDDVKFDIIQQTFAADTTRYLVGTDNKLTVLGANDQNPNGKTLKQLFDEKVIKASDFTITVTVTPILSAEKATQLQTQYSSLDLTGKSAEDQLIRFANDFLSKIQIKTNEDALTPEVTVETKNVDTDTGIAPQITISAKVAAANDAWPTLDDSVTMSSYADQLRIWVLARMNPTIKLKVNNVENELTIANVPAPTLYDSSQFSGDSSLNDVKSALAAVDSDIQAKWTEKFNTLLTNENGTKKLVVNMGQVLTKDLLDTAVEDAIQKPSNTLVDKVSSLGNGDTTRAAFMNLYRDFVVFRESDASLFLKSKSNDEAYALGSVQSNNLVLTLDFEKILRDAYYTSNTGSADRVPYEKLVDLVMALRNGISEDIRITSEEAKSNQTAQSVIASLILNQINSNRGNITAKKWGKPIGNGGERAMTTTERKELSNLLATLIMDSDTGDSMQKAWQAFEDSGYQSVEYSITLDAAKRAGLAAFIESFYGDANAKTLDIGFKVAQELK